MVCGQRELAGSEGKIDNQRTQPQAKALFLGFDHERIGGGKTTKIKKLQKGQERQERQERQKKDFWKRKESYEVTDLPTRHLGLVDKL